MPSKHTLRNFGINEYYHVYNRGVAKQTIYLSPQDYNVFLYFLKAFLSDPKSLNKEEQFFEPRRKNFYQKVELHCFCLMPNHYHLLLRQLDDGGISNLMRALSNAYTRYFNEKYERVGPVFQGKFKAAHINKDNYLAYITKYIHRNPEDIGKSIATYELSSLQFYSSDLESPKWIRTDQILSLFDSTQQYIDFVNTPQNDAYAILGDSTIDQ